MTRWLDPENLWDRHQQKSNRDQAEKILGIKEARKEGSWSRCIWFRASAHSCYCYWSSIPQLLWLAVFFFLGWHQSKGACPSACPHIHLVKLVLLLYFGHRKGCSHCPCGLEGRSQWPFRIRPFMPVVNRPRPPAKTSEALEKSVSGKQLQMFYNKGSSKQPPSFDRILRSDGHSIWGDTLRNPPPALLDF